VRESFKIIAPSVPKIVLFLLNFYLWNSHIATPLGVHLNKKNAWNRKNVWRRNAVFLKINLELWDSEKRHQLSHQRIFCCLLFVFEVSFWDRSGCKVNTVYSAISPFILSPICLLQISQQLSFKIEPPGFQLIRVYLSIASVHWRETIHGNKESKTIKQMGKCAFRL